MGAIDKQSLALFKEMMSQCKKERKAKLSLSGRELAKQMETTENYLSAMESGRAVPSLMMLFKYFVACGFDTTALVTLTIQKADSQKSLKKQKAALVQKIFDMDDEQVGYLLEQAKLAETLGLKIKTKK